MADLTTLTAELAGMKQKMVDRLVAQGDETIQPDDTMQTIVDHFDNLRSKIVNQDKEITANGEYTADEGYTGLGKVTVDVKAEPVPKYGATVDTFLGDVDANGVLQAPTEQTDLVFDGVKSISQRCFYYAFFTKKNIVKVDFGAITSIDEEGCNNAFNSCTGITGVNLSSLTTVGNNGLHYAFNNCTGITSVLDLSSLTTVGSSGLYYAFNNCTGITGVLDLSSLTTVGENGLNNAFYNCTGITGVNLSSLTTVGNNGLYYAFYNCKLLTIMSFPSLIKINGTSTLVAMFNNCSALAEIHFRADMQSTIENVAGYQYKFGATNATIYFDL